MSEGNFEVMPVGTMEELKQLRAFANSMIAVSRSDAAPVDAWYEVSPMINMLQHWYIQHNQKYDL
jgi:hypothetical protein